MFDFKDMGRLMELAREIDTDELLEIAETVDLPALLRVVRHLDEDQLRYFEREVRRTIEQPAESPAWRHLPFRRAAVLGAGTMGAQIAAHLANAGVDVLLLDISSAGDDRNLAARNGLKSARRLRPDPFFDERAASRIRIGNFDDDLERIREAEWIVEAVVERLDVKRSILEKVERYASEKAIVSTNTSGIPIKEIVNERSDSFSRRFLGTHFFNPPRYLKLLEVIPTAETDPEVVERIAAYGRIHLGKGVVIAKDVPYFIGNRVGVYAQLQAMRFFTDRGYSIEEVDLLTGPLIGRPKSATFRTADVVGLDVLKDVTQNLFEKAEHDESRDAFQLPDLLSRLVEHGAFGAKTGAGFYRKEGREILSVDPETLEYRPAGELDLDGVNDLRKRPLEERLQALYDDQGRAGAFFRETTLDLLGYAARRVPEITDNPADVDRALRWGFGWELGPFQMWDVLGFDRVLNGLRREGHGVPEWVESLARDGASGFYREGEASKEVFVPGRGFGPEPLPRDVLRLPSIAANGKATIWEGEEAALIDAGDGVAVYEFRSHGNALGIDVMQGLMAAIDLVERRGDLRGMVIGNEGKNFAVGANLFQVAKALEEKRLVELEGWVEGFQRAIQCVRYARKPVVVAVHQRVLGGACEMVMGAANAVASAESYIGLVELGVGLIPAGTGSTRLAAAASKRSPSGHPSEVQAALQVSFETVAMAKVSGSAAEARSFGYLPDSSTIVMNDERRLYVAKQIVIERSESGYRPPSPEHEILVLGRPGRAAFEVQLEQYLEGRFISEYDRYLGSQLARVMTGGDLSGPQHVDENYLIELEREVVLSLLGEQRTRDRITHMLETGKPLRN